MLEKISNPFIDFPNYNCFACSPFNKIGFKLDFYKDENQVISYYKPSDNYSGLPKVMHGGLAGVLLDELMFWAIFIFCKKIAFTTKMNVNYKKYIPTDKKITISARVIENKKRLFKAEGDIKNESGDVLAVSDGIYFLADLSTLEKTFGVDYMPKHFIHYCRS